MKLYVDRDDPINWAETDRPLSPSELCWMWKCEERNKKLAARMRRYRKKLTNPLIHPNWPFPSVDLATILPFYPVRYERAA